MSDWLAGLVCECAEATAEGAAAGERFKEYMGKSIKLALQFHDLELASAGTRISTSIWSMEDLAAIRYENPLWRTMMGRPGP